MTSNIEKVLGRGERIELLVDRTNSLSQQSTQFRRRTVTLKHKIWFKDIKFLLVCCMVIGVLLYILIRIYGG
jgi:vesicle-associated membrane protein 7